MAAGLGHLSGACRGQRAAVASESEGTLEPKEGGFVNVSTGLVGLVNKKVPYTSDTVIECHAGTMVAGVALRGKMKKR